MLKVNTQKISVEEFAKKYGFEEKWGDYVFSVKGDSITLPWRNKGTICIDIFYDNEPNSWAYPSNEIEGLLFDMIKNGDVIKEEEK